MRTILKENFGFTKQILKLSKSELIKSYKGAALGPAWSVIRPAITIFVYWFAFSVGLRHGGNVTYNDVSVDFFSFLMVGIVPWFFMSSSILSGANCFKKNRQYITKMRFPVSTIPTFSLLANMYTNILLVVIMYIILICFGHDPSIYNLQYFFYMPLMFIFFWMLSFITAPLSVISNDFLNLVRAIITPLFWLSGAIYNSHGLESEVLSKIINSMPTSFFINGFRNTFLFEKPFYETPFELFCFCCWMLLVTVIGIWTYRKLRKTLPDVL